MAFHVPFMVITPEFSYKHLKRLRTVGKSLAKLFPGIKANLKKAGFEYDPQTFMVSSVLSSIFLSVISFVLIFVLSHINENSIKKSIAISIIATLHLWALIIFVFTKYPSIIAKKKAADIDKHLIFALKDLLLHTSSGSSLFDSMLSVSESNYGEISSEFETVCREINSGTPTDVALEHLASRTDSEFLKKVIWQLINTIRAGGNLKQALDNIVMDLTSAQRSSIVDYANELNLWSLIYMLFAVAAPTIGLTMMIILSSFADMGINETVLFGFVVITIFIQIGVINFIKARRPTVEF